MFLETYRKILSSLKNIDSVRGCAGTYGQQVCRTYSACLPQLRIVQYRTVLLRGSTNKTMRRLARSASMDGVELAEMRRSGSGDREDQYELPREGEALDDDDEDIDIYTLTNDTEQPHNNTNNNHTTTSPPDTTAPQEHESGLELFAAPTIVPPRNKERLKSMESLDYATHDCIVHRDYLRQHGKWSNLVNTGGHWLMTVATGVLVGFIAFSVKQGILVLSDTKFTTVEYLMQTSNMGYSVLASLIMYTFFGCLYAAVACCMVLLFGPPAGGSGIPEVMGYLNGVRVEHAINIKTFLGKVTSIIFSFSSGLALGPEGPMIHIGSMLGGAFGQSKDKATGLFPSFLLVDKFRNDRDQRDFISSGAAAGVAAAFGAPVGGLLFSIEEASSFWSHSLTWRTFFCCMISAFTVNVTMRGFTEIKDTGMLKLGLSGEHLYHYLETIPFILIGIIGGLAGVLFIRLNNKLTSWRSKHIQNKTRKLGEVLAITAFTSIVCFMISYYWSCSVADVHYVPGASKENPVELTQMFCPKGYYNEMATMAFQRPEVVLRALFSRTQQLFSLWSLAVFMVLYFGLSVVTCGLCLAGGLFIPMMLAGAVVGRFVGELVFLTSPGIPVDPSIYALIGSAALMTGFCRLTLSLVVIMVELTENTQYLLPIILCVMVSKWSADIFGESLYVSQMHIKGIPYLQATPSVDMQTLSVQDVMSSEPVMLRCIEKVENIIQVTLPFGLHKQRNNAADSHLFFFPNLYTNYNRPLKAIHTTGSR
eukprot:TRINITY_DN9484_c0_g1_i2.p1 TRINITY_DN9484_c0_g1~~TRINITY_DN9484_c0_g1_i2.p1  ORF type:complete len:762 (-),score=73.52 TRINITY_DN9484_c0_g1_i2:870-3155(-)